MLTWFKELQKDILAMEFDNVTFFLYFWEDLVAE